MYGQSIWNGTISSPAGWFEMNMFFIGLSISNGIHRHYKITGHSISNETTLSTGHSVSNRPPAGQIRAIVTSACRSTMG
jgi:hypothetical protein